MRTVRWPQIIAFLVMAALAGWLIGLQTWDTLRSDLLLLLSVFAAALIQVAVTTANLTLPDYLTTDEAQKLSNSLERQQKYWIGLFSAIMLTILTLIIASKLHSIDLTINTPYIGPTDLGRVISAFSGGLFGFLAVHSLTFLGGLLSIQRLRSDFLKKGAARRAVLEIKQVKASSQENPFNKPDGYGSIYTPH